ncbi:hypothetical protein [Tenacibaculum amylolyticum]|uniref:hypothetical protein n=1 Tax=Tenacibaculum amylolyticum TaxID=104269 RepID=UPI0038959CCB
MKYQKSPFPYIFLLIGILSVAIYSNLVTDKQINAPIVHMVEITKTPEFNATELAIVLEKKEPQLLVKK